MLSTALLEYTHFPSHERYCIIVNGLELDPDNNPYNFEFVFGPISDLSEDQANRLLAKISTLIRDLQDISYYRFADGSYFIEDNKLFRDIQETIGIWK